LVHLEAGGPHGIETARRELLGDEHAGGHDGRG
jgi:hypothetical protein